MSGPPPFGGVVRARPRSRSMYSFDEQPPQQALNDIGSGAVAGDMAMSATPPFGGVAGMQPMKPSKDSKPMKPPKTGKADLGVGGAPAAMLSASPPTLERSLTTSAMPVAAPAGRAMLRTNLSERSLPPIVPDDLVPPTAVLLPSPPMSAARAPAAGGPPPKKPMMKGAPPPKPKLPTANSGSGKVRQRAESRPAAPLPGEESADETPSTPSPSGSAQYGDVKRVNRLARSEDARSSTASTAFADDDVPQFEGDARASQLPPPPGAVAPARGMDRASQLPPPPQPFRLPPPNAGRTGALVSTSRRGGAPGPAPARMVLPPAPSRGAADASPPPAGRAPTRGGSGVRAAKPAPAPAKVEDEFADILAMNDLVDDLVPLDAAPAKAKPTPAKAAAPAAKAEPAKDDFWDEFDTETAAVTSAPKAKLPAPNVKSAPAAPAATESDPSTWAVICEVDGVNAACLRCLKCNESMCQQCYDAMCDPATHETAVVQAVVCENDEELPAQVRCHDCAINYCQICFDELHQAGGDREHHSSEPIGLGLSDGAMTAEFGDLLGALNDIEFSF